MSQVRTVFGRHRACVAACLLASLALMSGCGPARVPVLTPSASPASAPQDPALQQELERIERGMAADPIEADHRLATLQSRAAPGSLERLTVLSLRYNAAVMRRDPAMAQPIDQALRTWPDGPLKAAAQLTLDHGRANMLRAQGNLRAAAKALQSLNSIAETTLPPAPLLRGYGLYGALLADVGDVDLAIDIGQRAVRLAEQTGSSWRHALALNDLSWYYQRAAQLERGQQINNEALTEALRDPGPMQLYAVYTNRSILFGDEQDKRVATEAHEATLRYARESGSAGLLALALGNYADFNLRLGNPAKALQLATQALPLARDARDLSTEILALHNAGIAKIALRRVEEGKRDVRQAIAMDEKQGALRYAADGWEELGSYLEKAGDLSGAIEADLQYRRLIDQVLRDESRKAVLEAQERYDDERRAREIELLHRANHLKSEQIRARELALKLWLALGGCVVLSAILLAMAYRRIRRSNQALAQSNESLRQQSESDPLTSLANRRFFQTAIRRLAHDGSLHGSMFLIDIDHFKRINDQYGHAAGDSVLIEVARRLRESLRNDDLIVRWGGEEFLIVVATEGAQQTAELAQRLLDQIGSQVVVHGEQRIAVTASIGFAGFPVPPHEIKLPWERAIDVVDTLMYIAKANGRNKGYGLESCAARSEAEFGSLIERLESAWHQGQVGLKTLSGPSAGAGS